MRRPGNGDWTEGLLSAIARTGAAPIAIVSISSVHWCDGGAVDLDLVAPAVRAQGAALLVDATHSAGVTNLDVRALDPDFVVFPTYKWLLGPYGRAWLPAIPMACAVEAASRPMSLALAAAAPNTPQVAVMCQPRA